MNEVAQSGSAAAATAPDTKTRILDAAETLFGIKGFQATSLRDITSAAGVNLAAVNYHFQSKDSLIDAVIARRIGPVNQKRLEMLEAAGPNATVEQILTAFLKPVYDVPIECIIPLLGRVMANPDLFVDRVFMVHLKPTATYFHQALRRALPDLPQQELLWRLQFAVGTMTHNLLWGRVYPRISEGLCDIEDRDALLKRNVAFLAAGFHAPVPDLHPASSPESNA